MSDLERLSFSIEGELLRKFESMVKKSKYENRSEFFRDMIRKELVEREWSSDAEVLGTVTLIYDHHTRGLNDKLTALQHDHVESIMASTHVHLDHALCAEMIMMKGRQTELRALTDLLQQQKGVLHAALSLSTTGKALGRGKEHGHGHGHHH